MPAGRASQSGRVRVLITGASGFAGGYLARECGRAGEEVVGISRSGAVPGDIDQAVEGRSVDLVDGDAVAALVRSVRPEVVYHLAALSSVGGSWEQPARAIRDNVAMAVNVLEAVRHEAPEARLVWASSSEVYGPPGRLPLDESAPLQPANPYAVSKASGDLLAAVYADAHGLQIIRARPFNHAGPGQRTTFVLSSLARQAAEGLLAGADPVRILTGNPDARRDFTDVRDVTRAYRLLAGRADAGIYNICSGSSISPAGQIQLIAQLIAPVAVEHVIDPGRMRGHEVMDIRGAHERITAAVGWSPEIPLAQTLADTIAWWKQELSGRRREPGRTEIGH